MDFKVDWTEPALGDLREIVEYICKDDPSAAERAGGAIIDHVETLRTFPFIEPTYPRGSRGDIREIVCGNYRIFYRASEQRRLVEILTIWHGARGNPKIMIP
jgi:toxin ParE1/3/4